MQKISALVLSLLLATTLGACAGTAGQGGSSATGQQGQEQASDVEMQYISPEEVKGAVDGKDTSYVIVDVRKYEDYQADHIPGSISADMDKAKGGDYADGKSAMGEALKQATGSETAEGKRIVLVCYSGKSYAQAGTNVLSQLGADMGSVYTLEGGMKAWTADYPDALTQDAS